MSETCSANQAVDPIAQREVIATRELELAGMLGGMLDPEGLKAAEGELGSALYINELAFVRVIRARVWMGTEDLKEVTRLEVGGYRHIGEGVMEAIVTHRDNVDGQPNELSDKLRELVWPCCDASTDPNKVLTVARGDQSERTRLDYDWLVAAGRNRGLPVRNLYRSADEAPVAGVREIAGLAVESTAHYPAESRPPDPVRPGLNIAAQLALAA